jgi:hypothetical protein
MGTGVPVTDRVLVNLRQKKKCKDNFVVFMEHCHVTIVSISSQQRALLAPGKCVK